MTATAAPLAGGLRARLSAMMFFQYAIWGAWLPILYPFLTGHRRFTMDQTGMILMAGAVGAVIGPFLAGQAADRAFATEKVLALSHGIGAVLVWFLADVESYATFMWVSLFYGLIYAPTLSLTNSLAFHHLPDRDRDFGRVRVWGTVGWIVAGIGFGHWLGLFHSPSDLGKTALAAAQNAGRADAFRLSALLGAAMAVYCLFLPHTPPAKDSANKNAAGEALGEIKKQPLLTLFLLAIPVSCIHQFYFVHTSDFLTAFQNDLASAKSTAAAINTVFGVGGGGLMTLGQMSELVVLALIPFFAKRTTRKNLLAVGLCAYAARMALFAYSDSLLPIMLGVALHGLCFGCFIFVAFMVVDEETTADVRATAQSLFNLVIIGCGIIVGSLVATSLVGRWAQDIPKVDDAGAPVLGDDGVQELAMDFTELFSYPMWAGLACLILLMLFYPSRPTPAPSHD